MNTLFKLGVFLLFVAIILKLIQDLGLLLDIKETTNYECSYLKDLIRGPEDFVKYGKNTILVSSSDNLKLFHKVPANQVAYGGIYAVYQSDQQTPIVQKLQIKDFPQNIAFFPLGIDEYNGKLYVINNAYDKGGERIEVFKIEGNEENYYLQFQQSILFPDNLMGALNDLVVIGDNQLLTTTWINFPDPIEGRVTGTYKDFIILLKRIFYQILKVKNNYVYKCQFNNMSELAKCDAFEQTASGLNNGIQWDKKNIVLVSKTLDKEVAIYQIKNNSLEFVENVPVGTLVDNIWYNQNSDSFYVGSGIRAIDYLNFQINFNEQTDKNFTYWGSIDEIYKPNKNILKYSVKNILVKRNAVYGMSGCIVSGENLYLSSWPDKTLGICRKQQKN